MIKIKSFGAQGDGLTEAPQSRHIPFTLPGESVSLYKDPPETSHDIDVVEKSPERVEAPCPHFGECGGCRLQHLSQKLYRSFKKDKITAALKRVGVSDSLVEDPLLFEKGRRRATLQFFWHKGKCELGFFQRGSHRLCDLKTCLVLEPELVNLIKPLKEFLKTLFSSRATGSLMVLKSEAGVDIDLSTKAPLDRDLFFYESLQDFVQNYRVARFCVNGEVILCHETPFVLFNGVKVKASARHFLQANQEAEKEMASILQNEVRKAFPNSPPRFADLFAGRGLFSFALKDDVRFVTAYEMDSQAIQAFTEAAKPFSNMAVEKRNLFANPLSKEDLASFDGVILDPPRDGAMAQSRCLAESAVPFICYVSCKPETFARDAKILLQGGYCLNIVKPIDQFHWSHHCELIAIFRK